MKKEQKANSDIKIYIAGPITIDPNYKKKFDAVDDFFTTMGYKVFNPTIFPAGLSYREYIKLGLTMLMECDVICMLPNSENSPGAQFERHYAELIGIPIIEL